jgi:uncharacterized protein YbjT (DUF2867 family)
MIVITTPTGDIGHQVVDNVLAQGAPVRLIVRDPAKLKPQIRERVEAVVGSHGDADIVNEAFEGADAVFWLAPPNPRAADINAAYVDFTRPAADAFKRHEVGRVVGISALGRGFQGNAGLVSASLAMDDLIAATGVNFRALTMPSFMDNMLRQVQSIKNDGAIFGPLPPDLKAPTCATKDIATAATTLLLDETWTGAGSVPVLGPEDLSSNDMAEIISDVLGRPVRYHQISAEAFKSRFLGFGASEATAQGMLDMALAKEHGLDNQEPRTPQATTPTTFRAWCEEFLKPAIA